MNKTSFLNENATAIVDTNMKVPLNPAPRKMARAVAFFEKNGLPPSVRQAKKSKKKHTKSPISTIQNELLTIYSFEPTEQQMQQLKDFLAQLFADKINELKIKQDVEMLA